MSESRQQVAVVIDHDGRRRRAVTAALASRAIDVIETRWSQALLLARIATPDFFLVALDVKHPNGLTACAELRRRSSAPIIAMTTEQQTGVEARAIAAGANECVPLSSGCDDLVDAVQGIMSRWAPAVPGAIVAVDAAGLSIDLDRRLAKRDGARVTLSRTEWTIVSVLVRSARRAVSYQQLSEAVWGDGADAGAQARLRVHMTYLRRKLEPTPEVPAVLVTEPGFGYRLVADVVRAR